MSDKFNIVEAEEHEINYFNEVYADFCSLNKLWYDIGYD